MGLKQIGISEMGILSSGRIKANRTIVSGPYPLSAEIANTDLDKVNITFDQILDITSIPATTAFVIAGKTIGSVNILGAVVTLTTTVPFSDVGVISVSYTRPALNPIKNISGDQASSFVNFTVTAFFGPIDLYAIVYRDTEVDLSWTDLSSSETGYRIYISTDGGLNYIEKGTTLANVNTYTATGLTAGELYYFYVVAYNGVIESIESNIIDTYFKMTINTALPGSANNTFILPVTAKDAGNYYIDWGAGGGEETFTTTGTKTHVYAAPGIYQVKIRGSLSCFAYAETGTDRAKPTSLDQWGNIKWSTTVSVFNGCLNLTANYIDNPNTSHVTDMNRMFQFCALFNGSVLHFNTSLVTDFTSMLRFCTSFKQSLAGFSLASATNLSNIVSVTSDINLPGTSTNYDATLIAWAAGDVANSLTFQIASKYSVAGGGQAARASLIADDLWIIVDGGLL